MENRIKHILLTVLPFAGLLLVPAAVSAQEDDRPLIEPDVRPQKVDEALIDTENFEIGAFAGIINIEDFESSFLWGGKLTYHLSETFFFEANVGFAEGGETSFEKLAGDVQVLSDEDRDYRYYNINIGMNVLPGEAFLTENYAFNTNFYLIGGAGATDFAGDTRFTFNVGAGYQVLLTDSVSIHLGVREHFYRIDVLGEEKTSMNTEVSGGLSVFF
ncbi:MULTISPECIES: outer membrane beta-barrel domain-containing protein [Marinobacter]|jgi:outer membrane beta-barrel protein|uniref:Outer membrane beta-barrel protein n=1 Tax=Marinobacter salarius TaxID=1420917 RepID=A0ABY1FJZ9_9GAMM|nr:MULTISPECIES: outer membrane beta-barrel domain-containing protein [Marinobacter]KXJ44018.1 MAG: outer membrane beta-barrel domain-containing protein [Marinobacter sp. Hex_13]MBJ7300782.1 outer membrane beta-barrel domain-containing protein [Marinobacter salarius]MBS8230827.1 outer membrane beta-barrel domain-containing protein [Marinobacter salarius]MCZ4285143.1 outer membrane beta-barrel domain-containing protein [Marinobacter salarius]MDM8178288.1 outer membrane beta-barrel domain-contai|tara:strand:- start:3849 stop:4496 length:648 start_codon:yes stop_codon:yes gene_type:complete